MHCSSLNKTFVLIIMISVIILTVFALPTRPAFAGIKNSAHDFSTNVGTPFGGGYLVNGDYAQEIDEVCVFCHTPHAASTTNMGGSAGGYLWNRTGPLGAANGFSLYTSSTLTMITIQNPTGISLMCLSCHDGLSSIAVGSVGGSPPQTLLTTPGSGTGSVTWAAGGLDKIGDFYDGWMNPYGPNIGNIVPDEVTGLNPDDPINLANDHPVAFDWVDGIPGIYDKSAIFTADGLKLFNNRMECSTCHNVHNNDVYKPFLRMSNANSDMCLKCHDK